MYSKLLKSSTITILRVAYLTIQREHVHANDINGDQKEQHGAVSVEVQAGC